MTVQFVRPFVVGGKFPKITGSFNHEVIALQIQKLQEKEFQNLSYHNANLILVVGFSDLTLCGSMKILTLNY